MLTKRDANVRFQAVKVVLLVLFYNGAFSLDSFRFRPVHYPRRWTKVTCSSILFCFLLCFVRFSRISSGQADSQTVRFLIDFFVMYTFLVLRFFA